MLNLLPELRNLGLKGQNRALQGKVEDDEESYLPEFFQAVRRIRNNFKLIDINLEAFYIDTERVVLLDRKSDRMVLSYLNNIEIICAEVFEALEVLKMRVKPSVNEIETTEDRIIYNIDGALRGLFQVQMACFYGAKEHYQSIAAHAISDKEVGITTRAEGSMQRAESCKMSASMIKFDVANDAYNHVSDRHTEILKIEKSLHEVHQLFIDMEALVNQQGEVVDRISFRVANAKADVGCAKEELTEAYQIKRKRCTIM